MPAVSSRTELAEVAGRALDLARPLITATAPDTARNKGDRDPVTAVDTRVEHTVRRFLSAATPDVGFLGEESGGAVDGPCWVLDPVDGTVNLTHDLPLCAVSLALVQGGAAVLAAVDLPFLRLRYSAAAGQGAYRDGHRVHAGPEIDLRDAVVSIGDYAVGPDAEQRNGPRFALTATLAARAQRIRMLGSAVLDCAWVADGRLGASVVLSNKPWEGAAGALLAREAGAVVTDVQGQPHTMASTSTVAAAPGLATELLGLISH